MTANAPILVNSRLADLSKLDLADRYIFTVDVEEWFQVGAFEKTLLREEWSSLESRVELQTHSVLDLLDRLSVKGTFFCLGWVADRTPSLIKEIAARGHELACHGADHKRLFMMGRDTVKADISGAKKLLEDVSSQKVQGYRAPSFSLNSEVWWVYDLLEEMGFSYSSSIYPVRTDHYGMPDAPRAPFYPLGSGILEIPMTVYDVAKLRMPASGGGYFRLFPYQLSKWLLQQGAKQAGAAGIFYMHPWEMDLGQPHVPSAPLLSRFRHYQGQAKLPRKLRRLSEDLKFGRVIDVYGALLQAKNRTIEE